MLGFTRSMRVVPCRWSLKVGRYRPWLNLKFREASYLSVTPQYGAISREIRLFSTTRKQWQSAGEVNQELAAKLESELALEKDIQDAGILPGHLQEYLNNSPFDIQDTPGKEEVVLRRTYGDENIQVSFSTDDLNNFDEDPDTLQDEDPSMIDEMEDPADHVADIKYPNNTSRGTSSQSRSPANKIPVAPEDNLFPVKGHESTDREGLTEMEDDQEASFPAHVSISIERPNKGTLHIDAVAQDGLVVIENVYFFEDSKLAEPKTIEAERIARNLYTGPPFGNLDEDLQVLFEKYLDERGVNTPMALFIPEYIDFKEQQEYLRWLAGIKRFVE